MLVKKSIKNDVYKKLLDYAFSKCDVISLTRYCNQHVQETKETMKVILSKSHYTVNDIVSNYSDKLIEEMYNDFLDDPVIFDDEYKKSFEKRIDENFDKEHAERFKKRNRHSCIWHALGFTVYNELGNRLLEKYKKIVICQKDNDEFCKLFPNSKSPTTYYFQLNDSLKKELLNKKSIYDWCFPTSLEDLCFYKNGYSWLYSVAHEEMCFIYCENEEEYEYLKSIGIEFVDDEFVPTPREKLYYEEY